MFFFLQTEIGISPFPQKCVRPWKCQATHRSSDVQQDVWNAKQTWPALLQKLAVLVAAGCIMSRCRECLCTEETLLRKWCMVKAKAVQCFCVCVTKTVFQKKESLQDLNQIEHLWDVVERKICIMDVQPTNC